MTPRIGPRKRKVWVTLSKVQSGMTWVITWTDLGLSLGQTKWLSAFFAFKIWKQLKSPVPLFFSLSPPVIYSGRLYSLSPPFAPQIDDDQRRRIEGVVCVAQRRPTLFRWSYGWFFFQLPFISPFSDLPCSRYAPGGDFLLFDFVLWWLLKQVLILSFLPLFD